MKKQFIIVLTVIVATVFLSQSAVFARGNYRAAFRKDAKDLKSPSREVFKGFKKDNMLQYYSKLKMWLKIDVEKRDMINAELPYSPTDKARIAYPTQKAPIAYPTNKARIAYPVQKAPIAIKEK